MRARAAVQSISYSKCGRKLARAEGDQVVVCDAETGLVESTLGVDGQVWCVNFSPDGEFIAAGYGYDGHIQMLKAQTGEKFQSPLPGHSNR